MRPRCTNNALVLSWQPSATIGRWLSAAFGKLTYQTLLKVMSTQEPEILTVFRAPRPILNSDACIVLGVIFDRVVGLGVCSFTERRHLYFLLAANLDVAPSVTWTPGPATAVFAVGLIPLVCVRRVSRAHSGCRAAFHKRGDTRCIAGDNIAISLLPTHDHPLQEMMQFYLVTPWSF